MRRSGASQRARAAPAPCGPARRCGPGRVLRGAAVSYLTVTVAPAPSRAALALSAASLLTFSRTSLGAPSTRSLASFSPRLVRVRTSLMTWIFLSPAASRVTLNSSFSSGASAAAPAPPAPGAAATATGAAALTSKVSSNCFTNSDSSRRVISLNWSSRSSVLSFAMIYLPVPCSKSLLWCRSVGRSGCVATLGGAVLGRGSALGRGGVATLLGPLDPQGLSQLSDLRRQRVEHRGRAGHRRGHRAGQLGQQHVARLQVRDPGELVRCDRLAVEHTALDHQGRVVPGEVAQTLGRLHHVATDERDGRRAGQQGRKLGLEPGLGDRDLGQGVLDHAERGVLSERLTEHGELGNAEPAVLGQHDAARVTESAGELLDGSHLVRSCHGPPLSVFAARDLLVVAARVCGVQKSAQKSKTPQAQARWGFIVRPDTG